LGPDEQLHLFHGLPPEDGPKPGFSSVQEGLPRAERAWAEAQAQPRATPARSAAGVASKLTARAAKPKLPTFAVQRDAILARLRAAGWDVKDGLKVPHATSRDGTVRYWFKTQAIYYEPLRASRGHFDFGDAHSLVSDMRERPANEMTAYLIRAAERIARR